MASIPRTHRRLCLAVAGAAVLTALTLATVGASPPTPLGGQAPAMTRLGASPSQDPGAGSPPPGFVLENGRFTPVAIPRGQEQLAPDGINPVGINDRGQIVGMYSDTSTVLEDPGVPLRGFLYDRGRYVRLDPPGAVSTQALGINDRGQVVGDYFDADGVFHGYVWERGRFRTIDVPGAAGASATDINNRGQITGSSFDDRGLAHGFVLDRGRLTTFDAPNATFTAPFGLNDRGQIVGFSAGDPADITTVRGFLLDRGRFTPINRPGAAGTAVFDINNRRQLVGVAGNPEDQASARPHRHPASGPHGLTTPATH